MSLKVLNRKQVTEITTLSRSTIYMQIKAGEFPRPIRLGPRRSGWLESDIEEWIQGRIDNYSEAQ